MITLILVTAVLVFFGKPTIKVLIFLHKIHRSYINSVLMGEQPFYSFPTFWFFVFVPVAGVLFLEILRTGFGLLTLEQVNDIGSTIAYSSVLAGFIQLALLDLIQEVERKFPKNTP